MITSISIENFKGIGDRITVPIRPITLLFGPNSAGKSSVMHAIHYAREVLERHNLDADQTLTGGDYVDLGGYRNFIHDRITKKPVVLEFDLDFTSSASFDLPDYTPDRFDIIEWDGGADGWTDNPPEGMSRWISSATVSISIAWSQQDEVAYVSDYTIILNDEKFCSITCDPGRKWIYLTDVNFLHPVLVNATQEMTGTGEIGDASDKEISSFLLDCYYTVLEQGFLTSGQSPDHRRIALTGQRDALPRWSRPLAISLIRPGTRKDAWKNPDHYAIRRSELSPEAEQLISVLSQLIVGPGEVLLNELKHFRYLGPLRDAPARAYSLPRFPSPSRWANGLAAWDMLHIAPRSFVNHVSDWLSSDNRLNTGYGLNVKNIRELDMESPLAFALTTDRAFDDIEEMHEALKQCDSGTRIVLVDQNTPLEVLPQDVGIGISQLIPVVVLALDESPGLCAVEQPELHLHPGIQVSIGELFIFRASQKTVWPILVETHSEHMLLRLLRRIRETHDNELPPGHPGLSKEQVSVVCLEKEGGSVRAYPLRIDDTGEFVDRWPKGFFEERAEELF
ncbi:MAG: AAA family ATPase [Pirellulales bacterium]|nr:AAA family ATPase [Pirellulales bacterium]